MALRLPKCPGQASGGASFRWVCATLPGDRIQPRPLWQGVPGARLSSQRVLSDGTWLRLVPLPVLLTWVPVRMMSAWSLDYAVALFSFVISI